MSEQLIRLEEANIKLSEEDLQKYLDAPDVLQNAPQELPVGYKRCGHCRRVMKLYLFNRNKNSTLNCSGNCKECQKETSKAAYKKAAKSIDYKASYARNREKKLERSKQYYREHKEEILKKQREYHGTRKGRKVMQKSHAKRKYLLEKNAGIPWTKELVIDRDKLGGDRPICILCGKPIARDSDIHMEHLIPVVLGGKNCFTNVACAHELCNLRKSKDAREITVEQVDELVMRSEKYIDEHPQLFADLFPEKKD